MWTIPQSRQPELMDDPSLPADDHFAALDALARINAVSLTAGRIAAAAAGLLRRAGRTNGGRPIEIVDVACGGGEVTAAVARRIVRRCAAGGRAPAVPAVPAAPAVPAVLMTGLDVSPRALDRARRHCGAAADGAEVTFAVRDVVAEGCPACDVAVCSLFLHHLDDARAADVLAAMAAAARVGIVVSDLVRSRAGLVLARLGTLVLSGSRVARVDGPLSVRAARTPDEYRGLLHRAGLAAATVRRIWPERVLLEWARGGSAAAAAATPVSAEATA